MEFGTCTEGSVPYPLLDKATVVISSYLVSFCADDVAAGSASLVIINGEHGLLTAAHIVNDLLASRLDRIAIVYSQQPARPLLLDKKRISPVQYGPQPEEGFPGPDIAFVQIDDSNCMKTLKEEKAFYELSDSTAPSFKFHVANKLSPLCLMAGAPEEMSREEGVRRTSSHVLINKHFFARTQLDHPFSRDGFDYFKFSSFSGTHDFPANYSGVSGGGVWHIPLCQDPDDGIKSLTFTNPELVGLVFYQSKLADNSREITAHNCQSVIRRLGKSAH